MATSVLEPQSTPMIDLEAMCRTFPNPKPFHREGLTRWMLEITFPPYCPLGMLAMWLEEIKNPRDVSFRIRYPTVGRAATTLQRANPRLTKSEAVAIAGKIMRINDDQRDPKRALEELRRAIVRA